MTSLKINIGTNVSVYSSVVFSPLGAISPEQGMQDEQSEGPASHIRLHHLGQTGELNLDQISRYTWLQLDANMI